MNLPYSTAALLALQCAVLYLTAVAPDPVQDCGKQIFANISVSESAESTRPERILLNSSAHLNLSCTFNNANQEFVKVIWEKNDQEISNQTVSSISGHAISSISVNISSSNDMGNYTCRTDSLKGTFSVKVPETEGREKPLISYEGDTAVLKCKTHEPHKHALGPLNWTWYRKSEGIEKAVLNENTSERYTVEHMFVNAKYEGVLKIKKLTENDNGIYVCRADFQVAESSGEVNLKVLSYMVPLKPFLIIVAEVIVLVALILLYEVYSKKKQKATDDDKEAEQAESLKPEGTNGMEESSTRQRKV